MKICFFGDYDPTYNRIRVMQKGLRMLGEDFVEVNVRSTGLKHYRELWDKYRLAPDHDIVLVAYSNSRFLPLLARMISRKPIVWDPLYSLYDNWVFDRKLTKPHSLKAYYYWLTDWLGCFFSHKIFLDTNTNAKYFHDTFFVNEKKLGRVLVGADDEMFAMAPFVDGRNVFEVEFHGKYIPVQGTEILVHAAKLLENDNVHFTMIGSGQEVVRTKELALELGVTNVTFLPFLQQEEVREYIRNADVCVGLVGDVPRVVRAIPNKMYEASAMGRVVINVDSSSLREVFNPGVDAIGVRQGDAEDMAKKIREIKLSGRAAEMGKAAREAFDKFGTPEQVAKELLSFRKTIST